MYSFEQNIKRRFSGTLKFSHLFSTKKDFPNFLAAISIYF
jgi:hypothetical protein